MNNNKELKNNPSEELNQLPETPQIAPTEVVETAPETEEKKASEEDRTTHKTEAGNTSKMDAEKAPTKQRKFPSWIDLFALVGVFVLSVLLGSILIVVCGGFGSTDGVDSGLSPKLTMFYYLVQMLPPIIYVIWARRKAGRRGGIHFGIGRMNAPMLLWGVVLLLSSSVVIEPLLVLFPPESYDAVTNVIGRGFWSIMSVVVCAPLLEEVLFRGLIFESCRERFGGGGAVLISALLFGLIHGVAVQVINAFIVGIILGYIYLRTRSLANVIILHAINNAIAYLTMGLGADTLRQLIPQQWLYWSIYAVASVIFVLSMVKVVITLRDNRELE